MKLIFLLFVFSLIGICCLGQSWAHEKEMPNDSKTKAYIDASSYDRWPITGYVNLSGSGKYISYFVGTQSMGCHTLILQTSNGSWKRTFYGIESAIFTRDEKRAILSASDKVYIVRLGGGITDSITDVVSFKLQEIGNGEWIAYRQGANGGKLVLRNLERNAASVFMSVREYYFSGKKLVLVREEKQAAQYQEHLDLVNISNNEISNIWNGKGLHNIVFSEDGSKLAFIGDDQDSLVKKNGVWCFQLGIRRAYYILPDLTDINAKKLELSSIEYFSRDNSRIFVTLKKSKEKSHFKQDMDIDTTQPEIWNYSDRFLQSQQQRQIGPIDTSYMAIVDIGSSRIFRIEEQNEFSSIANRPPLTDSVVVFHKKSSGESGEEIGNSSCNTTPYLVSTRTGQRTELNSFCGFSFPIMSRNERYLIYSDKSNQNFFTYEIASGITTNITKNIKTAWSRKFGVPPVYWINNDSAIIMYDQNDLWLLDPKGFFSPVNLTNGFGKKNGIQLFLNINIDAPTFFAKGDKIFLTAFNPETKENGFYSILFGRVVDPILLRMEAALYDIPDNGATPDGVKFTPIKAERANSYIVRRMTATEYPNLFYTTNFRTFVPITDFHPQKNYNWYSTELHKWKSLDGRFLQGILYKPENFDSTKKYPIIFNYYELMSDGLNAFLMPKALDNGCVINIPYYVSKGYLVFCPDIEYTIGDPMQGTYDAIISAANHLSKLPFVDGKKMGLQGCSWGGIQTNYLVTQTNLFAAACSASGIADWISGYNSLFGNGSSMQGLYEVGQPRIGGTLWDSLHSYIKSSPILQVDKISTPLLLMHTKDDAVCLFTNAVEFFTALRRLGKRSWMLVYEGDHGVYGNEANDFSIRMAQFFDHYLKGSPAPFWMTRGVPAKLRGKDTGLSLDYTTKSPAAKLVSDTLRSILNSESR